MDMNLRRTFADYVEQQYQGKEKDKEFHLQMELANNADARMRMINILFDDMKLALEDLNKEQESQFRRRTFIRTMFAHIEAELSMMRQIVVVWQRLGSINLSNNDLRKLADEIETIWDATQIHGSPIRLKLTDNIKFTFQLFGLTPGKSNVTLDTNSQGWQAFVIAISIRDRLMHPKIEQNLIISEIETSDALKAWGWYTEISRRVLVGK